MSSLKTQVESQQAAQSSMLQLSVLQQQSTPVGTNTSSEGTLPLNSQCTYMCFVLMNLISHFQPKCVHPITPRIFQEGSVTHQRHFRLFSLCTTLCLLNPLHYRSLEMSNSYKATQYCTLSNYLIKLDDFKAIICLPA